MTNEILITDVRHLSYNDAKKEIVNYIKQNENRKVYISELAEIFKLDIELIAKIINNYEQNNRSFKITIKR